MVIKNSWILAALIAFALASAVTITVAQTYDGVARDGLSCANGMTVQSFVKMIKADGTIMTAAEVDAYEVATMKAIKDKYRMVARTGWVSYPADCTVVSP